MTKKKIMLADDEEVVRSLASALIGDSSEYSLTMVRDGEEALRVATEEVPDLIFLDVMMPKLDGIAVCRALKANQATAHVKVVMLTALAQPGDIQKAEAAGADGYFTKPYSPTKLLQEIEQMLDS